jgi:RNA polymerase sigma-70 factor (ECF subfamily)
MGAIETDGAAVAGRLRRGADTADTSGVLLEQLFTEHERQLGKYLVQMVRDRELAEDLLQDVFHQALLDRDAVAEASSPVAWLFGIARNKALAALRRRRRFWHARQRLARRSDNESASEHELVAVSELLERRLTPEDRALVLLRYLHGFTAVELGEMTGSSAAAIRQRLARARARLLAHEQPDRSRRNERD